MLQNVLMDKNKTRQDVIALLESHRRSESEMHVSVAAAEQRPDSG